jgi:hypothetical protein
VHGTQAGCLGAWPFGSPVSKFHQHVIVCPCLVSLKERAKQD